MTRRETLRDKWTVDLECPRCGRLDVARLSQADGYAYVRGKPLPASIMCRSALPTLIR